MKTFDYDIFTGVYRISNKQKMVTLPSKGHETFISELQALGAQGWEVVKITEKETSVSGHTYLTAIVYLKKEKS